MIGKLRWHCNRPLEQHFNVKKHGMVDRWSTYWWITMHKIFRSMMSKLSRWHCDRVEWQYLNLKTCYHEWNRYWKTGRHDIFTCMISMLSTCHCNRVDTLQDIICMLYPYHRPSWSKDLVGWRGFIIFLQVFWRTAFTCSIILGIIDIKFIGLYIALWGSCGYISVCSYIWHAWKTTSS